MQLNGGKIKEVQVSLLLSSRAEMQKVIEKARQATSTTFVNKFSATQQSTVLSAAVIANQFAKKIPDQASIVAPQPPVISLTNFLTQSMQQQSSQSPAVAQAQQQQLNLMSAYQTMPPNDLGGLAGAPAMANMPMGIPQNAAAAAAAYANYYATLIDPKLLNYTNPLTAGLNANHTDLQRDSSSRNNDPRGRRSNSRERNTYRRHRSRSNERNQSRRSRSHSRDRYTDSDKEGKDASSRRRTRFSAATDKMDVPNMSALPPNLKQPGTAYGAPPPVTNSVWEHPPPQVAAQLGSANSYPNFNNGNSSMPPTRHYQTESKTSSSSAFGDIGTCVKVTNVDNETFYSDLRKFFIGLPIGSNDIKFVTDSKGNRTGVALVRFLSSDSKKQALTKSMYPLKSTQVIITSITEEDFDSGLMNANKGGVNRQSNFNNYRNEDRQDSRNDRFRDRSNSHERDNNNRTFNRYDGNNRNNNHFDGPPRQQNNRDQGNFRRGNFKNEDNQEQQQEKVYKPDENFKVLIIDDIPRTANEPDIFEAFPNILSITIERYTAYVKFTSHEAAKVILENRFIHYIRNKRVFFEAGSEAQFNDMARRNGKQDNPDVKDTNQGSAENGNDTNENHYDNMNEDTNHSSNSNSRDNSRNSFESRDPRQRNFSNDRFGSNGPPNTLQTDCVIMKNMETDTKIEEVEHFFKDIGIYKMRVHILLDKKGLFFALHNYFNENQLTLLSPGQPCGDCFVEFKYPNDSQRALSKNNQFLKQNRVQIMLIPREQVEAVLSSFGGDDSRPPPQNNRPNRPDRQNLGQNRPDWAPPDDFGSPGCVLMLSNLCYRASIDDILEEFREFDLRPDQIIRRFNDLGQPTGNACINFNSPEDADMAIEKYNSVKIMDRSVWLKRI